MKKLSILLVSLVLVCSLSAKLMQPTPRKTPIELSNQSSEQPKAQAYREAPEFEFVTSPIDLITNYYDYMPGSYNGLPVHVQPDEFGGVYLIFHGRETADATRRVYYTYINEAGQVVTGTIGIDDFHEGYAGIDIDLVTGDPIAAWHVNSDGSGDLEVVVSWDLFHISPGIWVNPFVVIDDNIPSPNGILDEFIWPYVYIGPSPIAGKRRVYIQANNAYSATDPSENPMIAYADFESSDIGEIPNLEWFYLTIPIFDEWNQSDPEWIRPFHSFVVSEVDGRIAFFGYNTNDKIYVCYNDNYGEGDWTYVYMNSDIDTWNPQNLDETYVFLDANGDPEELFWNPIHSGHMNSVFHDGSNIILMELALGLHARPDASGSSGYYPLELFPYTFHYDFNEDAFSFIVQAPQINENAIDPEYVWQQNTTYIPWDTDNDSEEDEFDEDGNVIMFNGWPIYNDDVEEAFGDNNMKMVSLANEEHNWLINVWQDGLKNMLELPGWEGVAEIYITVSNNGGESWSDPIIMNAKPDDVNYCEELDGMKPCYIYPGDKIEDMGDGWGLVHLMFFDDDSFGPNNSGGMMKYATMRIDFDWSSSAENNELPMTNFELCNFPNPFNPSTTISFELTAKDAKNAKIEIYNLKGQKVDQLRIMNYELGINEVAWNAEDFASGVYFYQLKLGDEILASKKCLLLK